MAEKESKPENETQKIDSPLILREETKSELIVTSEYAKIIEEICLTNIQEVDVLFDLKIEDELSAHSSISYSFPEIYSRSKMPAELGETLKSLRPVLTRIGMIAYYIINDPKDKPPYTNGWDLSETEIETIKKSLENTTLETAQEIIENPDEIQNKPVGIEYEEIITAIAYLKVKIIFEKIAANENNAITVETTEIV